MKKYVIFGIILILQLINIFIWADKKEGYYIDELWSYGLANSYYEPFLNQIEEHENNWHEPEYYRSYLVVDENETFVFSSVYYNQEQDVHPPMYYFLLHGLCSFFPGIFSKWFGLIINIIFFIGTLWILFEIGNILFEEKSIISIVPVILYGFSIGAINTVIYIRMYMMLVFWALLFVYLTLLWINNKKKNILAGIFVVTTLGFLTHYFFIVFAAFCIFAVVIWDIFHKKLWDGVKYSASFLIGIVLAILLFPESISHIFKGNVGHTALSQMTDIIAEYGKQIIEYANKISLELLGLKNAWIVIIIIFIITIILSIIAFIRTIKNRDNDKSSNILWILSIIVVGYFLLVAKIQPLIVIRYQYVIYPCFFLLTIYIFYIISKKWNHNWLLGCFIVLWIAGFFLQYSNTVDYLYIGMEDKIESFHQKYETIPGVYIVEDSYSHVVINDCIYLQQQNYTYPIDAGDEEKMYQLADELPDKIVVYLSKFYEEERLSDAMNYWNYQSAMVIDETDFTKIYVLERIQ